MTEREALARRAFDAFNAREADAFAATMHPDIVFTPLLTSADPYRGREGMRRFVEDAFAWTDAGEVRILGAQEVGDVVVLRGRIAIVSEEREFETDVVYVLQIRDGLICELVTLADAPEAQAQLGLSPSQGASDLRVELPAVPDSVPSVRRAARADAAAAGVTDLHAVELAITEAATNAVLHAYIDEPAPGAVTLVGRRDRDDVLLCVQDEGRGLLPRDDSPGLGMGLAIMHRSAAEISFVGPPQRTRGTEVRLRFPAGRRA
jgi:anti-sigma regulatory factor (Ser/Thr protein kinase)